MISEAQLKINSFLSHKVSPRDLWHCACEAAQIAVDEFVKKHGEPMYCGSSHIIILEDSQGKFITWLTQQGLGDSVDKRGKTYKLSYYSIMRGHRLLGTQSLDLQETAMDAVKSVLELHGIKSSIRSWAD
jgi:hypothetical protein